jgi:DNA-binding Xre family transcriptional regulator
MVLLASLAKAKEAYALQSPHTGLVLDVLVLRLDDQGNMDEAVKQFGRNLRTAREEKGWTQEVLADKSGLAAVQVSRVERGVREIRLTTLLRLVVALETTPDKLLKSLY